MVARFKPNNGNGQNGHRNGKSNGNAIEEARGRGRPSKYQSSFPQQAAKLCKLGATDVDLADFFEVDISTFYRWMCIKPDFREAIKTPKETADLRVERSGYMKATGFWVDTEKLFLLKDEFFDDEGKLIRTSQRVHHEPTREYYPPDMGAIAWWQKNRQPDKWRDKHEIDGTIRNEHIFTFNIFENDLSANAKIIEGKKSVPRLERRP
jgi:hypothetical protein